jgi:hypothetical protein
VTAYGYQWTVCWYFLAIRGPIFLTAALEMSEGNAVDLAPTARRRPQGQAEPLSCLEGARVGVRRRKYASEAESQSRRRDRAEVGGTALSLLHHARVGPVSGRTSAQAWTQARGVR